MSKHTPGPWMCGFGRINKDRVYATDGHQVAACGDAILRGEEEKQANAKLIAAAPDLLAALQDIRRIIHGRGLSVEKLGRCHAIAEAMILKATGE